MVEIYFEALAEDMLRDFRFEDLLEMNDLSEEDVLSLLLQIGMISEPERYFD